MRVNYLQQPFFRAKAAFNIRQANCAIDLSVTIL